MAGMDVTPPPDVTVRPALSSDAASLATLLGQLGYPTDTASMLARLGRMDTERDLVLVAIVGDEVCGTATLHMSPRLRSDTPVARMSSLVVAEALRGHGIGERLVQAVEAEAVRRGCAQLDLVSEAYRDRAHAFFRRLGYEEVSHRSRHFAKSLVP